MLRRIVISTLEGILTFTEGGRGWYDFLYHVLAGANFVNDNGLPCCDAQLVHTSCLRLYAGHSRYLTWHLKCTVRMPMIQGVELILKLPTHGRLQHQPQQCVCERVYTILPFLKYDGWLNDTLMVAKDCICCGEPLIEV